MRNVTGGGLPGVQQQPTTPARPQVRRPDLSMLLGEIFQVALQAIRANKLRSFLTMLASSSVSAPSSRWWRSAAERRSRPGASPGARPDLLSIYPGQSFRGGIASCSISA